MCSDQYTNFARPRILTGSRTRDPECDLAKVRDLIPPGKSGSYAIKMV